jgi:AbrB family looped-hinge helix DNA binding protein
VETRAFSVRVGPKGRIVLPAPIRREVGLEEGAEIVVRADRGRIVLESRADALERLRAVVRDAVPPSLSLVDELLDARRAESERERSA